MLNTKEKENKTLEEEVSEALRKSSALIKEETKRWNNIHNKPSKNEIKLVEEEDHFIIDIEINTKPATIINNQNITRSYKISKKPSPKRGILQEYWLYTDICFAGGFSSDLEKDIALIAPYSNKFMYNFGIGPAITTRSVGIFCTYSLAKVGIPHVIIASGPSFTKDKMVVNFMIGVKI